MTEYNKQCWSIQTLKSNVAKMVQTTKSAKKVVICRVECVAQSGCIVQA